VFTIVRRNTRVPEMLSADLDSEVQACLMARAGWAPVRALRQERSRPAPGHLDKCRDILCNELLAKIADGEYAWEDYASMTASPIPSCTRSRWKMTKRACRITLDFKRHRSAIRPVRSMPARLRRWRFLIKWIAPILRISPIRLQRAAEIHVNEGVAMLFDVVFPPRAR